MAQRLKQYPFLDYASKHWGACVGSLADARIRLFWPRLERFASRKGAIELASQCRSVRSITNYRDWSQRYPRDIPLLVLAACFHMPNGLRRLIAQSHPVDGKGSKGETALLVAVQARLLENVRVLLDHGADANAGYLGGMKALHIAAFNGETDIIQALVGASADINARVGRRLTPLMVAAMHGRLDAVKALIGAGADVAAESEDGMSAITLALLNDHTTVATYLADEGAVVPRGFSAHREYNFASK
jgi:hypothetical protein